MEKQMLMIMKKWEENKIEWNEWVLNVNNIDKEIIFRNLNWFNYNDYIQLPWNDIDKRKKKRKAVTTIQYVFPR